MEKYLLQLLDEQNRVIIPDFGAFIIKQKKPRKILFNEFLQYNDGALIGLISKTEKTSRDDAAKKVLDYVTELRNTIKSGKSVVIKDIGIIKINPAGKIVLEEEGAKTEAKSTKTGDDALTLEIEEDTEQKKEIEKESKAPEEKKTQEIKAKPTVPPKPEPTPIKKEPEPTPVEQYYGESKNNRLNIIIWVIIIIVINGAIIGYFLFKDNFIKPKETEQVITKDSEIPDNLEETETPAEENIIEEIYPEESTGNEPVEEKVTPKSGALPSQTEPTTQPKAITGTRYYIVAGVFSNETNAENLLKELRSKGYNAEKFGKIGNMHAVSYNVFKSKQEADQYLFKIKKEVDASAWIKKVH